MKADQSPSVSGELPALTVFSSIGAGDRIFISGVSYQCIAVEKTTSTRLADSNSETYAKELRRKPLNRYLKGMPKIERFQRGDVITEWQSCSRLKSRHHVWNVYYQFVVKKGDL